MTGLTCFAVLLATAGSAAGGPAYYGPPRGDACSGLWPLPRDFSCSGPGALALEAGGFRFTPASPAARESPLLQRAFQRFHGHIFTPARPHPQASREGRPPAAGLIRELRVAVASANESLQLGVDESYALSVNGGNSTLSAATVWGALHGLETFSQLTIRSVGQAEVVFINSSRVMIADAPRFAWRGVMIDSSRHWLPVSAIRLMVDAIAFNRMNTLHWHITDAQSFPLKTTAYPRLVEGAYGGAGSTLHYDAADVKAIVAYAKDRGVRVVPEIDSPGHSASWQIGYPEIGVEVPADWYSGMVDPTKQASFELLEGLFGEVAELFEDSFIHIGADEVDFKALNSTASVVGYMQQHQIPRTGRGFKRLIASYIERLCAILASKGKTAVAWQEAMDHYGDSDANPTPPSAGLPSSLVVQQWLSPVWNWANLSAITGDSYASTDDPWPRDHNGFRALVSQLIGRSDE